MTSIPTIVSLEPALPAAANSSTLAEIVRLEEEGLDDLSLLVASRAISSEGVTFVACWLRFTGCRDYRRWWLAERHSFPTARTVLSEQRPAGLAYPPELALYHLSGRSTAYEVYAQAVVCQTIDLSLIPVALQEYRRRLGGDAERLITPPAVSLAHYRC